MTIDHCARGWWKRVSRRWDRIEADGLAWYAVPALRDYGVCHGVTTRHGGVSQLPGLRSLNLGWNRPDPREAVAENYQRLANAAGFLMDSMALVNYEHGDGIARARNGDGGVGWREGAFAPCDALVSDSPDVTLITLHADCMPVFLFDPQKRAGAMIHAGWKGTSMRIAAKAVGRMTAEFGSRPQDLIAAVGPSISQARFEVGDDVLSIFAEAFALDAIDGVDGQPVVTRGQTSGKAHIDLWAVMALQLMEVGVQPAHMTITDTCTFENKNDFFSYRRDGRACGAMAGFLRL